VQGPNGEFVLFAVLYYEGLKAFQFNGWRFVEVPISSLAFLRENVASVRAFSLDGNALLSKSDSIPRYLEDGNSKSNLPRYNLTLRNSCDKTLWRLFVATRR